MDTTELLGSLSAVRSAAVGLEEEFADTIAALPAGQRPSARNLVHYLAVRRADLRTEQEALSARALSSLGRADANILATLDRVIGRLAGDLGDTPSLPADLGRRGPTADEARRLLLDHATAALGPVADDRRTRIMVTLPSEAATDGALVDRLVAAGMTVARINTAHDGPNQWRAMVAHVRRAAAEQGRRVRIMSDLGGPKLRTGPLPEGPGVAKRKPTRDAWGNVVEPATIRFVDRPEPGDGIPVTPELIHGARSGDEIRLVDARGRRRRLRVTSVAEGEVRARVDRTVYVVEGGALDWFRDGARVAEGHVGPLPDARPWIDLGAGDDLELRAGDEPGAPARRVGDRVVEPAHIGVPAAVLDDLAVGHRVLLDDGTFEGVVTASGPGRAVVRLERPAAGKLRADKGVNLPDTPLRVAALTDDDVAALDVVVPLVDLVAMSFVAEPADVDELRRELDVRGGEDVGVVLKIERREAFERLPDLLLAAMAHPPVAVMVARGDLAVEVGFGRMAEVQEQILWLAEAAHVPAIWATQVLESLAKDGTPTRAEVTDAASAVRAECVMLNKGPHIDEAVRFLDDILVRMQAHQGKRMQMMRALDVARTSPHRSG